MGPASAYASVLTSIDTSIATILSEQADIFTFDKIEDGIVNIRDFQTTGVVALQKPLPSLYYQ